MPVTLRYLRFLLTFRNPSFLLFHPFRQDHLEEMMHKKKIELMFSRPSLKGFIWLGLFVLQSSSLGNDEIPRCTDREPVETKVGDVAKLPCNYKIKPGSLKPYKIYWQHENRTDITVVVAYVHGKEDISNDSRYANRSKMDEQNLTLSLFSVKVSDRGVYKCVIIEGSDVKYKCKIQLSVTADFTTPVIDWSPNGCGQTSLKLTCSSHGGYPKPNMYGSVNNESVNWIHHIRTDNKTELINVSGNVQINVTEEIVVTCSIGYPESPLSTIIYLSRAQFTCPLEQPSHGVIAASTVILAFIVFIVLAILFRGLLCTCQRLRSYDHSCSPQPVATNEISLQFNRTSEAVIGKQVL